jgi:hypothetical protein
MRSKELEQMVMRECSFLSHFMEEYEKDLQTQPNNEELREMLTAMKAKWEAYDKVYRYIKKVFQHDED